VKSSTDPKEENQAGRTGSAYEQKPNTFKDPNTFITKESISGASILEKDRKAYLQEIENYQSYVEQLENLFPKALGSFHLNLSQNTCSNGRSPLNFVLKQAESGTADGYFEEFFKLIAYPEVVKQFRSIFNRANLLRCFQTGQTKIELEYPIAYADGIHWRAALLYMLKNPFTGDVEGRTYAVDIDRRKYRELIVNELVGTEYSFVALLNLVTGKVTEYGEDGTSYTSEEKLVEADYTPAMEAAVKNFIRPDKVAEALEAHSLATIKAKLEQMPVYSLEFPTRNNRVEGWHIRYLQGDTRMALIARHDLTEFYQQKDEIAQLTRKLDGIPGGIAIYKREGGKITCISVNKRLGELLGAQPGDFIGRSLSQLMELFLEPGEQERFWRVWPVLTREHPYAEETFCFHTLDKSSKLWVHSICHLVEEPGGQRLIYCAYADVTRLVCYERELQETHRLAEERYAYAVQGLSEDKNQNLVARGYYNFTKNQVLNYTVYHDKLYQVELPAAYDEIFAKFLQRPYPSGDKKALQATLSREQVIRAFERGQTNLSVTYRYLISETEPMWITIVLRTYLMPKTGDIEGFSYAYDITEKKLRESIVDKLGSLGYDEIGLVYSKSGFWSCYLYENQQRRLKENHLVKGSWEAEIQRYVRDEVVTHQGERVLGEISLSTILAKLQHQDVYTVAHTVLLADNTLRQKQLQFFYLNELRETIFYSMSDITAQFAYENEQLHKLAAAKLEADQANQAKSNFLNGMSHDLRTPLNGIMGFTQLAIKTEDPVLKQDYLRKIETSGELLLDLVNDTLELSRIESGKLSLNPIIVDGRAFWQSLVTALIPSAQMKGVRLVTDPELYPAEMIKVDQLQVKKVLLNIISNALKYTPAGGQVKVEIKSLSGEDNGFTRRLVVEDNGIGMSAEFMERMYEPFAQEHRTEAVNVTGTGLGLAIVKRIVDLMKGRITVESKPNVGTRFTIDLPVEHWAKQTENLEAQQALARRRDAAELAALSGKQVLLCEDNYLNAEIAMLLLKDKKMKVDWVKDGRQGIERFSASMHGYYDFILMDIRMPNMDGYEATRAIRSLDRPDAGRVPIVAMSANAFAEDMQEAQKAGMTGYVTKPIKPELLYEALCKLL